MLPIPPEKLAGLPVGVYAVGQAVGDFQIRNIPTKTGTMQILTGKVLAGETFCEFAQRIEPGKFPHVPRANEKVIALIVASYKTNNVFKTDVEIVTPPLLEAKK
jgi:hypothetical protein